MDYSNIRNPRDVVKRLNVIDNILFEKMAENTDFCEELINTVLSEKVTIVNVIPQDSIRNLQGRSVRLDVLCKRKDGTLFNVEVQKSDNDDHQRRVRYNTSCITANVTEPGTKFENVPDVCIIYISNFDVFGHNLVAYHIDRCVRETGEIVSNGMTEIYVYAKARDSSDLSKLMEVFTDPDKYDFERFPATSKRKQQFKETEEGEQTMCTTIQEMIQRLVDEQVQKQVHEQVQKQVKEQIAEVQTLTIFPLVSKGKLSPKDGADSLGMPLDEFLTKMAGAGFVLPSDNK